MKERKEKKRLRQRQRKRFEGHSSVSFHILSHVWLGFLAGVDSEGARRVEGKNSELCILTFSAFFMYVERASFRVRN